MNESPSMPDNEPQNTVEKANTGTPISEKQNDKRLGIKEFIFMLIIIFLVWALQRFVGH